MTAFAKLYEKIKLTKITEYRQILAFKKTQFAIQKEKLSLDRMISLMKTIKLSGRNGNMSPVVFWILLERLIQYLKLI